MNLLTDKWIPVKRKEGQAEAIAPWQLTEEIDTNPIVSLDLPRPDFNGAMVQFLIGLLQTAFMPDREGQWRKYYDTPPSSEELKTHFAKYEYAFNLDGDGPRFMQDSNLPAEVLEPQTISSLLIDEPAVNTVKENRDHFIKRNQIQSMSFSSAAFALFTLQLNAPAGGAGHRTSLRGGGPLTTLVIPKNDPNLWRLVWLNVLSAEESRDLQKLSKDPAECTDFDMFPWLSKTQTSEVGQTITPSDAEWRLVFWATPRRIQLLTSEEKKIMCDISGYEQVGCIKKYVTKNYGANYTHWLHPLSPHYSTKSYLLPMHPNVGGISYRNWLGWTLGREDKLSIQAAKVVSVFLGSRYRNQIEASVWAFGYDMDNMKARGWQESKIPLFAFSNEDEKLSFRSIVQDVLIATEEVVNNLKSCVKNAWKIDKGTIGFVETEFLQTTEGAFQILLTNSYERVKQDVSDTVDDLRKEWHQILLRVSMDIFDRWVMSSDSWMISSDSDHEDSFNVIRQRSNLEKFNYKAVIKKVLHLPRKIKKEAVSK